MAVSHLSLNELFQITRHGDGGSSRSSQVICIRVSVICIALHNIITSYTCLYTNSTDFPIPLYYVSVCTYIIIQKRDSQ